MFLIILSLFVLHTTDKASAEGEEPCLFDMFLDHFDATPKTINIGESTTFIAEWRFLNPHACGAVVVKLIGHTTTTLSSGVPKTLSPLATATYRLKAIDNQPNTPLKEIFIGDPVTVTVLEPPPPGPPTLPPSCD